MTAAQQVLHNGVVIKEIWHVRQKAIKDPLPPVVVDVTKPVFDKLGDESFLGGCERCATQNANESLHHVIWGFAPKDQFTS